MGQAIGFSHFCLAVLKAHWDEEIIIEDKRVICAKDKAPETDLNQARRKTWKIFKQAVAGLSFSEKRLNRILDRYTFELDQIASKGELPLVRRMIETIATGAALPLTEDLSVKDLSVLTPLDIQRYYNKARKESYVPSLGSPISNIRGGPGADHEYIIYDPFLQDQKLATLFQGVQDLNWDAYLERLTMAINGHEMPEGTIIPAPGGLKGSMDFYKLYKAIAGEGLYAIALAPISLHSQLPPIVCFRCTQIGLGGQGTVESWMNNAQKNIGQRGYEACAEQLKQLVNDKAFNLNRKIWMTAYSLGGAHGGFFLRDFWPHIKEAHFFRSVHNAPGVAEALAKEIRELPPYYPIPNIFINRVKGDWASYFGGKHVGWGFSRGVKVKEYDLGYIPKNFKEWGELHSTRTIDTNKHVLEREYYAGQLLHELDNQQRGEAIKQYEEMRRSLGDKVLYHLIDYLYRILQFVFRLMGIKIFRSSFEELNSI